MIIRRLRWRFLLIGVLIMTFCSSCVIQNSHEPSPYGYRSLILGTSCRFGHTSLSGMYDDPSTDTIMVVYTRTPLEQRRVEKEPLGNNIFSYFTLTECLVLDVIKNNTDRDLRPGDEVTLGQDLSLREVKTDDGGTETVLYRAEPAIYPLDAGHPYVVFCDSNQAFGEAYLYWVCPFGLFDVSSRDLTENEIDAMTPSPDMLRTEEFVESRKTVTQWKAAAASHTDLSFIFEKYEGDTACGDPQ